MILTHPGLTKLTFMDYLLTMLRNWLRRKLSCDTLLLLEPSHRRTLPSESTWAAVHLGAGQFSAVLASGASGHRLFALQLQRGCRCAAQRRMYFWCCMLGGV